MERSSRTESSPIIPSHGHVPEHWVRYAMDGLRGPVSLDDAVH